MNASGLRSKFNRKEVPPAAGDAPVAAGAAALPEAERPTSDAEAVKVEPKADGAAKPEAAKIEAAKPDTAKPDTAKPGPVDLDATKPETVKIAEPPAISPSDGSASEAKADEAAAADTPPRAARLVEGVPRKTRSIPDLGVLRGRIGGVARAARPAAVPAAAAAALILALGIGYGIGSTGRSGAPDGERLKIVMAGLQQTGQDVARLNAELKSLRGSVETIKSEREKSRGEIQAKQAQLGEKVERLGQESLRTQRLAEQVEKTGRILSERLDKLERPAAPPVAAAPTPPPKPVAAAVPPDVAQTGSISEKKVEVDPRKTKIEGIYIRDIDDGFALIEMKNGGYMDVAVGFTVPGIGRVEAIERRGRQWVVVTPKGYIGER